MEYLSERHVAVLVAGLGAYREQCRNDAALNLEQGRERCGVPPKPTSTRCIASAGCPKVICSQNTPRKRPECDSAPTSTNAGSPQGVSCSSSQSQWISSPGGCSISTVTEQPRRC
jgi:hypothetical protein